MNITDLPVLNDGCRGYAYNSLECLSDVKYQGLGRVNVENAYWMYTNLINGKKYKIDDVRCRNCKSPDIGWKSARGIYRNGKSYYNVLRLGRVSEEAEGGLFTCHIKEDSDSPVSVNITACESKVKIYLSFFIENIAFCFDWHYITSTCSIRRVCIDRSTCTCTCIVPIVLYPNVNVRSTIMS